MLDNLKKVFIVRHGVYGDDYRLSEHGKAQMHALAGKLAEHVVKGKTRMLSFTAPRAGSGMGSSRRSGRQKSATQDDTPSRRAEQCKGLPANEQPD